MNNQKIVFDIENIIFKETSLRIKPNENLRNIIQDSLSLVKIILKIENNFDKDMSRIFLLDEEITINSISDFLING